MSDERTSSRPLSSKLDRLAERLDASEPSSDIEPSSPKADLARLIRLSEQYEGPFPHPEVLRRLDEVVGDGAERAFAMAEREQGHRHSIDRTMLDAEVRDLDRMGTDRRILIVGGMIIIGLGLIMSFVAALRGNYVVSGVAGGAAVLAAIGGSLRFLRRHEGRGSKDQQGTA